MENDEYDYEIISIDGDIDAQSIASAVSKNSLKRPLETFATAGVSSEDQQARILSLQDEADWINIDEMESIISMIEVESLKNDWEDDEKDEKEDQGQQQIQSMIGNDSKKILSYRDALIQGTDGSKILHISKDRVSNRVRQKELIKGLVQKVTQAASSSKHNEVSRKKCQTVLMMEEERQERIETSMYYDVKRNQIVVRKKKFTKISCACSVCSAAA